MSPIPPTPLAAMGLPMAAAAVGGNCGARRRARPCGSHQQQQRRNRTANCSKIPVATPLATPAAIALTTAESGPPRCLPPFPALDRCHRRSLQTHCRRRRLPLFLLPPEQQQQQQHCQHQRSVPTLSASSAASALAEALQWAEHRSLCMAARCRLRVTTASPHHHHRRCYQARHLITTIAATATAPPLAQSGEAAGRGTRQRLLW